MLHTNYTYTIDIALSNSPLVANMDLIDFVIENAIDAAPITIIMDSSIDVAGDNNTILLSSTGRSVTRTGVCPRIQS